MSSSPATSEIYRPGGPRVCRDWAFGRVQNDGRSFGIAHATNARYAATVTKGYLWKKGPGMLSSMKRRLFTLSGNCIEYHCEGKRQARGRFCLRTEKTEPVDEQFEAICGMAPSAAATESPCRYLGRM